MAEKNLTIVAKILAKKGKANLVKQELLKLITLTRAEVGCVNYDLHQDNSNEHLFLFYENWENKVLWEKHMESKHLANYAKATDGFIEAFTLHEMSRIV